MSTSGIARRATSVLVALVVATFGIARVHAANPVATLVTACGTTISQAGSYALAADLGPCTGDGIDITTSGVTLDLQGHTITGPGATSTAAGVAVPGSGTTSVTITSTSGRGSVLGFGTGVRVSGTSTWAVVVSALDASHDGDGVDLLNSPKAPLVENVTADSDTGTGILLNQANGAVVANDTADNDGTGLAVEGSLATQVTGNTFTGNAYGIANTPFTFFVTAGLVTSAEDNVATGNTVLDINEQAANCIADVWLGNTFGTASQTCVH